MKRCLCLLPGALLLLAAASHAGDLPVKFSRKRLRSEGKETVWYRYRPGQQGLIEHVKPILTRQGLKADEHYFLDRNDKDGILAVTGAPETVALVLEVISFLDEKRPQVRISVRMAETILSGDVQSGLDVSWDRKTSERTFFRGFEMDNRPQAYLDSLLSPKVPFQGTTTEFGTVDAQGNVLDQEAYDDVGAMRLAIRAVSEYQNTEILAQPDLLVTSGIEAEVFTGGKYPYQQITYHGTNTILSTQFLDVGVTLKVTPWVIGGNKVRMKVLAQVTNIVGYVEIGQGTKNPYTDLREIQDTVLLENGTTLALGGLYQNETAVLEKGIPLLMDIPLLGFLFKSYWTTKRRKELRVYITPRIVEPYDRFFIPPGG